MPSLSPEPGNDTTVTPFLLASKYPFSPWADLNQRNTLHPVLVDLWNQIKSKYWFKGHPAAGALFFSVYEMSRCESFHAGVGK